MDGKINLPNISAMTSVKVKFRVSSSCEQEGKIYYQIINGSRPRQIGTSYKIFVSEWDAENGTITETIDDSRKTYIKAVRESIRLDLDRFRLIINQMEKEEQMYTAADIVKAFRKATLEGHLFEYMKNIIGELKRDGRIRTAETYQATLNSIRKFRGGSDVRLDAVTRKLAENYEEWLKGQGISPNTISFYMRIFRAVYRRSIEEGLTEDRKPFQKVYTGVEKTAKRAISLKMIRKMKQLDLSKDPEMDYARDMFILSFMLRGMSFVDMAKLKKTDLKKGILNYRRSKTGQLLTIRWTEDMQRIVKKYQNNKENPYLLPIIRNPKTNAFYTCRNVGYKINKNLKGVGEMIGLPVPITMYAARHSWASAAKAKGAPMSVISEGLGHDSEKTTQIYLASLDGSVIDRLNTQLLKELA